MTEDADTQADIANVLGQLRGLSCIAYALIRSHPDPECFAQHLREVWRWWDSPHQDPAMPPAFQAGAAHVLEFAERGLRGTLGVRPPSTASRPAD